MAKLQDSKSYFMVFSGRLCFLLDWCAFRDVIPSETSFGAKDIGHRDAVAPGKDHSRAIMIAIRYGLIIWLTVLTPERTSQFMDSRTKSAGNDC